MDKTTKIALGVGAAGLLGLGLAMAGGRQKERKPPESLPPDIVPWTGTRKSSGPMPSGKGIWTSSVLASSFQKPVEFAAQMEAWNMDWACIFTNQMNKSTGAIRRAYKSNSRDLKDYVSALHDNGQEAAAFVWPEPVSQSKLDEWISETVEYCNDAKFDSIILDIESTWSKGGKGKPLAEHRVQRLTSESGIPVGFTCYPFPAQHPSINWDALAQLDFGMPMAYSHISAKSKKGGKYQIVRR